ncbi:sugar ABC transporter ATP-binding protein [Mesorhizobium sp. M0808]|uniref:sugar ABC transporter ATP-binding protein n=1 Tax=Mesorhizobium sp. M0808 TaxID=2957002 RepID=UPI003337B674
MSEADEHACALEMAHVGKRFDRNWVLEDVNLKVRRGSIHAIVGHNGAGKSTLMKIALGAERPTAGEVRIGGRSLTYSRPAEARALGLGMVMQERSLIATMTGIDNIFLNAERQNALGGVDLRRQRTETQDMLEQLGIRPSTLRLWVSDMSTIEQELIEIAKALRLGNRVLVLDEATAPLGSDEIERLFAVLRAIAARGTGIVLITHHLSEVFAVSDEVTCLREGKVVLSCATKSVDMAALVSAMLGRRSLPEAHARRRAPARHGSSQVPTLTVRNLRVGTKLRDISVEAFAGEVLGIVGPAGSGRTTLLRALFGDLRASDGALRLFGRPYRPHSPADAIAHGVFLVPQDRAAHGLVLLESVAENIILVALKRLIDTLGFLKRAEGRRQVRQMIDTLGIRVSSMHQPVQELSGGNQQKVVLAKALTAGSQVLLFDEPTFGVDIAAAREIITRVRGLADAGATVLWVSSDLLETTSISDRIVILRDGIIRATFTSEDGHAFSEHYLSAAIHAEPDRARQ